MKTTYPIVKKNNQYRVNLGTHEMIYDQNGHYLGQWQPLSVGNHYFGEDFIDAVDGGIMFRGVVVPVADLTHSEMDNLEFIGP